jgi:predicted CxxxxCH...CXXCH cytochrome family protein
MPLKGSSMLRYAVFTLALLFIMLFGCSQLTDRGNSVSANKCGACHEFPATSGAHLYHANKNIDCQMCHPGTGSHGSFPPAQYHLNGRLVVIPVDPFNAQPQGSYDQATQTCISVFCHGGGQKDTLGLVWNTNRVSWERTDTFACTGCHDATNHQIDAINNNGAQCYDCHRPLFHTDVIKDTTRCGSCHDIPPSYQPSHLYHVDTLNFDCNRCHAGYSRIDTTVALTTHINGVVDVNGLPPGSVYNWTDTSCSSLYCHGNFNGGNTNNAAKWNDTAVSCGSCHGIPPSTGQHESHMSRSSIDCNNCHAGYQSKGSPVVNKPHHANGKVDVDGTLGGGAYVNGSCNAPSGSCHSGQSRSWQSN